MAHKLLDLKAAGDAGQVVAEIATLNVKDKDGDVTLPGYFGKQHASIVLAHDWHPVMLGKGSIHEAGDKAVFKGQFNMSKDDPEARAVFSRLKFDQDNPPARIEWSYGYETLPGGETPFTDHAEFGDGTFLGPLDDGAAGVKVAEVSPVMIGAGEGTGTVSVKQYTEHTLTDKIKAALHQLDDVTAAVSALHDHLKDGDHDLTDEKAAVLQDLIDGLAEAQATVSPLLEPKSSIATQVFLKHQVTLAKIRELETV